MKNIFKRQFVFLAVFTLTIFIGGVHTAFATNTAPVLDSSKSPTLGTVIEDPGAPTGAVGVSVSSLVDATIPAGGLDNVFDADGSTPIGVAITATNLSYLTCFYSQDSGATWNLIGLLSGSSARTLDANSSNRVFCQPNADVNGTFSDALTIKAWDESTGTDGGLADTTTNGGTTAYSTASDTVSLIVTAVNDAPIATNLSAAETYTEDTALNLIDIVASDVDSVNVTATLALSNPSAGTLNVATSGATTSTYNAGTGVWSASGAIAEVNTLLAGVTFTPSANFNSSFTIATSVSDGILSVSGSKSVTGTPVNDAPVLDSSKSPTLSSIATGSGAPTGAVGTLVSSIVDFSSPAGQVDNVTDIDSGASLGIAITGANTTNATYFYSLNGGTTWSALGAVSNTSARLLAADSDNRIYVQPSGLFTGAISDALTFKAWDQTSGSDGGLVSTASSGGTTAFSTASDTVSITVTSGNHAPVAVDDGATVNEDDSALSISVLVNDTDLDSDTLTVASVTTPSHGSAVITGGGTRASYTPTTGYCGSDSFDYTVSDGHGGTDTGTVSITVDCLVPQAPTSLTTTTVSTGEIHLSWTTPSDNGGMVVTAYKIERESPLAGGFSVLVANTGSSTTTYSDIGLNPDTQYNYRVSAINTVGAGDPSNESHATTNVNYTGIEFTPNVQTVVVPPPAIVHSSSGTHFTFTKNLRKGADDTDVMQLQKFLDTHGFVVASSGWGSLNQLSTFLGSKTVTALKKYQASVGLPATGYFGPQTRAYINTLLAGGN